LRKIYNPFEEPTAPILKEQSAKIQAQIATSIKDIAPQMQEAFENMEQLNNADSEALAAFAAELSNSPKRKAVE